MIIALNDQPVLLVEEAFTGFERLSIDCHSPMVLIWKVKQK